MLKVRGEAFADKANDPHDYRRGHPSFDELMAQQGTGPITDVSSLHGDFWPEEEDVEDFIAAYREWRGHKQPGTASPLDPIIEDLKTLPPEKLKAVAAFVTRLKETSEEVRQSALSRTAGCLSPEEADAVDKTIEEGCETIDEEGWRPMS